MPFASTNICRDLADGVCEIRGDLRHKSGSPVAFLQRISVIPLMARSAIAIRPWPFEVLELAAKALEV